MIVSYTIYLWIMLIFNSCVVYVRMYVSRSLGRFIGGGHKRLVCFDCFNCVFRTKLVYVISEYRRG